MGTSHGGEGRMPKFLERERVCGCLLSLNLGEKKVAWWGVGVTPGPALDLP